MFAGSNMIRTTIAFALVLAGLAATPSQAQWAWKDGNGRVVYSDRPPPSDIKPANIMRQPNTQTLANPAPASGPLDEAGKSADGKAAEGKAPPAPDAPKTVAERDMEYRKRQQERAESEKKAAEEQNKSAMKSAECERARRYMKSLMMAYVLLDPMLQAIGILD